MVWDLTRRNHGVAFGVIKMDQLRASCCYLERCLFTITTVWNISIMAAI